MLFDLAAFIVFMSGPAITAVGSTIALGGTGHSVVKWLEKLRESGRKDSDYNDLLWDAFIKSADETFKEKVLKCSLLDRLNLGLHQVQIEGFGTASENRQPFIQIVHNRDQLLSCYSRYFAEMREVLEREKILSSEHLRSVFHNIEVEAFQNWRQKFCSMCANDSLLKEWLNQKQLLGTVSLASGVDDHLLRQQIRGDYWTQTITFGKISESVFARPNGSDPEDQENWWNELSRKLDAGPLFLSGPGGIGKSAFLVYLYQTIIKQPKGCPFGGVFLLSLDTMISGDQVEIEPDEAPFYTPDKSPLLTHLAKRVGDGSTCENWRTMLKWGTPETADKPILLLLDGLNEMRSRKLTKGDMYQHIISEIAALANRSTFRNVRLIVTSRIEFSDSKADRECQEQLNDLPMEEYAGGAVFQLCTLSGITVNLPKNISLSDEMQELLRRPMYYKHFHNRSAPSTQYAALKDMYQTLSEQSIGNIATDFLYRKRLRKCVFEILLPIIAYHCWINRDSSKKALSKSYKEFVERCTLVLIADRFEFPTANHAVDFAKAVCREANDLLKQQEQILTVDNGQYIFYHQDYRDYLVAEYFIQRLTYLRGNHELDSYIDISTWVESLRLNMYGQDILKLIYQAIPFQTNYVGYFSGEQNLSSEDITPACILWYTVIYQLSDLKSLVGAAYAGDLQEDTLFLLRPLVDYVLEETALANISRRQNCDGVLPTLSYKLKFHLTEVLMKACELYRYKKDYSQVINITRAAKYVYKNHPQTMASAINHNIAMAHLYNFMESGDKKNLYTALKMLYKCAKGTVSVPPYRFSCNVFALLLVSPHPKLEKEQAYKKFVRTLPKDKASWAHALWAYYDAIFDVRKEGEDWLLRLYSVRQFLFLLAENKVEAILRCGFNSNTLQNLAQQEALGNISFCKPSSGHPIPTTGNLHLIKAFLKKISRFERSWIHYLNGLVCYFVDVDTKKARLEFKQACDEDARAALWLAYLDRDRKRLRQIYETEQANAEKKSRKADTKVNSYHAGRYFERDFGGLYRALCNCLSE